jgi:hypothetical protein
MMTFIVEKEGKMGQNNLTQNLGCCCHKRGPEGPAGPPGPVGPPGISSIISYGYVYTLPNNDTDTIAGGNAIRFSSNGPLLNIIHSVGSKGITIQKSGTYMINYSVNAIGIPEAVIAIAVNDIIDPSTRIKVLTPNTRIFDTIILNLTANDVITIVNDSHYNLSIDDGPIVGAQLTIIQIA